MLVYLLYSYMIWCGWCDCAGGDGDSHGNGDDGNCECDRDCDDEECSRLR